MSEAYRAEHTKLAREVAIQRAHAAYSEDNGSLGSSLMVDNSGGFLEELNRLVPP